MGMSPEHSAGPFRYRAFLSYSSIDRTRSKALQAQIETYRLPAPMRARAGGRRLGRIFRDRSDLPANSDLTSTIRAALRQAEFLIVVCSPDAAASRWVNEEIRFFQGLGRQDAIIPVIARGTPTAYAPDTNPDGAFAPALFAAGDGTEPLAPDLREIEAGGDGFEMAALKIVSRMLDVPLDELTERHIAMVRADRRRVLNILATVSVLGVAALIGAILAWMQTQTANRLLVQVLDSVSEEVTLAAGLRDRYGVPSDVSEEFYGLAQAKLDDLAALEDRVGNHPGLLLEQTRFALGMADFSEDLGLAAERSGNIETAMRAFSELRAFQSSPRRFFTLSPPGGPAIEDTEQRLTASLAHLQSDRGDTAGAVATITGAIDRARTGRAGPAAARWQGHLARNYCDLGDIHYAESDYPAARTAYENCHAEAAKAGGDGAEGLAVDSLVQVGMIARAENDPAAALAAHRRALDQALALAGAQAGKSSLQRQLAQTYGALGDSLRGARQPPDEAVDAYGEGLAIIDRLLAADPARRDWQHDRMLLLERSVDALTETLAGAERDAQIARLDRIDALLARLAETSDRLLAVAPEDAVQRLIHATLLERRAVASLTRGRHLGLPVTGDPAGDIEESVALRADLAGAPDASLRARYNLVQGHIAAGRVLEHFAEDPDRALGHYDAALGGLAALVEGEAGAETRRRNTDNWRYEMALIHYLKAGHLRQSGRHGAARQSLADSEAIIGALLDGSPGNQRLSAALDDLATLRAGLEGGEYGGD